MELEENNWDLSDYPKELMKINNTTWIARIKEWNTMVGVGRTQEEAENNLEKTFIEFKTHHSLPEPGKKKNVVRYTNKKIKKYHTIAVDFFNKIFNKDFDNCFVSDDTRLDDFIEDLNYYKEIIHNEYKINLDSSNPLLYEIFDKILKNQNFKKSN